MKNLLLSLGFIALFGACKKDSDDSKPAGDYLKAHKWATVSIKINPAYDWFGEGSKITDIFAILDDCDKDDLLEFAADGSYYTYYNTNKCSENEPEKSLDGKYTLSTDQKQITRDELEYPATIKEISDSKLVLETYYTEDNVKYTLTETYKAQ